MTNPRRTDLELAVAILTAIIEEGRVLGGPPPRTRVQARVYLNWVAFHRHLERLRDQGLIDPEELRPTDRGYGFLRVFQNEIRSVLERYGF